MDSVSVDRRIMLSLHRELRCTQQSYDVALKVICFPQGSFPCRKDGPVTLGHEFVGTIDELGSKVTIFKVGQRVAVDPNSGCDKCDHCHNGNYHYCELGGINTTIGIYRNGGWATHALVPETQVCDALLRVRRASRHSSSYPALIAAFAVRIYGFVGVLNPGRGGNASGGAERTVVVSGSRMEQS